MERGIPVRSLCRGISALQAINRHGSLSLMEIAKMIGLPYPTAYRIVQTLVVEGLIECETTRKYYRATALAQSLSSGFVYEGKLLTVARPHIVALTQKITWPVSIATHVGQWMMVRDTTNSLTSLAFSTYHPGHTFPILECASGLVYMAFSADEERECIIKGITSLDGRSPTMAIFESRKLLERIREDGFATNDRTRHTLTPGKTSGISAPIFEDGKVAATLTMSFFSSAMRMEEAVRRFAPDVKRVAADITAALEAPATLNLGASKSLDTPVRLAKVVSEKQNRQRRNSKSAAREVGKGAARI